ncbi:hypothetical protein FE810_16100 [Thalassotalea litorea]|uniref:Uncharacterized protein n=1 Tax=Thalassotalea litorea TaxID=2020715 RepID=A0A5R9ILY6_9GAMM|nr:hypothetical protein [Thalassotalea litorea]TLU61029.1 hypothetical protein FE810_16100 [Thalassotalea litorea]
MKKLYFLLPLFVASTSTLANEQTSTIDTEFVKEVYEYCISMQSKDYLDKNLLLECINLELKYYEHSQFKSIEEIEKMALNQIKSEE